jgi:hypothetical protein
MKLKKLAMKQQVQTTHGPKGRCASPLKLLFNLHMITNGQSWPSDAIAGVH